MTIRVSRSRQHYSNNKKQEKKSSLDLQRQFRQYLQSSSVNKLMNWFRTDYLSSLRTDDMVPDRISNLRTNGLLPFLTDDLFTNRLSILPTNYTLRTESLLLNGLFIPRTNDSLYDWLPEQMTFRSNHSTSQIYLCSASVNKLMTWSRTDYLSSLLVRYCLNSRTLLTQCTYGFASILVRYCPLTLSSHGQGWYWPVNCPCSYGLHLWVRRLWPP